ncbi:TonB-dependent receptor [Algivirga pacifica]|uniref:TonB-dependent receptor n=1 Tax=Algivirga pacifica TaxID=1162670 RepID=A0ABP9D4N7_9BACT
MRTTLQTMYSIFFLMMLYLLPAQLWAQEGAISGRVLDEMGEPLPGVSIVIKGTTKGAATDFDGNFQLLLNQGEDVLTVSYIGYISTEVVVGNQTNFTIQLKPDVDQLEEVVVIGYGSVKKDDLTGSVQSVTAADFNQGAITSPQELVNGKMPGVQIVNSGGAPGAGATIRIRGGSSLNASNDPLIIIDGVPVANDGVNGMRNPLNTINPNDIETFTVLKDASATAIYGSRASNGVIIITTKKGSQGGLTVDYAGKVSVSTPTKFVDVLDGDTYRNTLTNAIEQGLITDNGALGLMGDANTDWQSQIYRTAVSTDHNVSVAGSIADAVPFRTSVGYSNNNGVLKGDQVERTTLALNLTPTLLNERLKVNTSIKYAHLNNKFANQGAIGSALAMDPTQPIMMEQDGEEVFFNWGNVLAPRNPLAQLEYHDDRSTVGRLIGNVQLDYKFHFLPELKANLNVGLDRSTSNGEVQVDKRASYDNVIAEMGSGTYKAYNQVKTNKLLDFYMQYAREFGESRFDVMAGYSYQHFHRRDENGAEIFVDLPESAGAERIRSEARNYETENYLISFFGRANYSLKDKYLVTATLRQDGSSRFSAENRWGLFPALAFGWNMKKEGFLEMVEQISALKFRAGYGVTGQQDIFGQDYAHFGTYSTGQPYAQYVMMDQNGNPQTYIDENGEEQLYLTLRPNAYNSNLKWEETETYNIGLDYGLFDDRFTGTLEAYYKKSNDLLNVTDVAAGSNFSNRVIGNVGNIEIKGLEFAMDAKLVTTEDLFWSMGINATYTDRKVTQLTAVDSENFIGVFTGGVAGGTGVYSQIHTVGQAPNTFFLYQQVYDENGNPINGMYVDQNGDGKLNEQDLVHFKQPAPIVMIGLNTNLSYKKFEFSASGRANLGNYVYNNIHSNSAYNGISPTGDFLANINESVLENNFTSIQLLSDYFVRDASFFRLDNVSVGYNIESLLGEKVNARVHGSVNNVFVLTKYDGMDPEISGGIDNNFYPRPRTYTLGLNVTF